MKAAILLLLLFSHDGRWIGGQPQTVTVSWNIADAAVPSTMTWTLFVGGAKIASGEADMPAGAKAATIDLTPPVVRVSSACVFEWQLTEKKSHKKITAGRQDITLYPALHVAATKSMMKDQTVLVFGKSDDLSNTLKTFCPTVEVRELGGAFLPKAGVVVIAPDALTGKAFELSPIEGMAGNGAHVLILRQTRCAEVLGMPIITRTETGKLDILQNHPLLDGFGAVAARQLFSQHAAELPVPLINKAVAATVAEPSLASSAETTPEAASEAASEGLASKRKGSVDAALLSQVICPLQLSGDTKDELVLACVVDSPKGNSSTVTANSKGRNSRLENKAEKEPVKRSAFLFVRKVGKGSITFCQVPFFSWTDNPLAQMFLNNFLLQTLSGKAADESSDNLPSEKLPLKSDRKVY